MSYFDNGGTRACSVLHRRSGKDTVALHQTNKMAHVRKGVYWHMLRTERQTRKAIWDGIDHEGRRIMEHVFPRSIRKSPKEFAPSGEMLVELKCGSLIMLLGSDNFDSHVGSNPIGVNYSEYSLCKPSSWDYIRPILRQNGGWASFIFTPRGKNHGWKMAEMAKQNPKWFYQHLNIFQTGVFADPQGVIEEERREGMAEELIQQEYMVDFTVALVGSYFGQLLQLLEARGGMREFMHSVDDVYTSWDLGHGDSTVIWFWQLSCDGVDYIDHYEANGQPMSHYFDLLEEWALTKGYRYKKHWLPHDARAKTLQTGSSIVEQCVNRWGRAMLDIAPELSIADGIQAARWLLQRNVRFHPRVSMLNHAGDSDGIECLKQYHKEWNDERHCFENKPEHDWTSHTADSFRYSAVVVRHAESMAKLDEPLKPKNPLSPFEVTLDEMFEAREAQRRYQR